MKEEPDRVVLGESQLHNWKLVMQFREVLVSAAGAQKLAAGFSDPQHLNRVANYLSLFLLGLFNPVIKTMRGLCQASHLEQVQEEVCERSISLGSFSETQHLVEPQLLERVFEGLAGQLPPVPADARLGQWQWLARDGSLFRALPRMQWALYGGGRAGCANRAVRLHLSLNVLEDKPVAAAIRPGRVCERQVWRQQWKAGQAWVGDSYFGEDYRIFRLLALRHCVYVLRLRPETVIEVQEELPLTDADRREGVLRQGWARLGSRPGYQSIRLRVVWVRADDGSTLILATNLTPEEFPAELVSLLYRKRWKVELFFRWIKCILGCRHWLAESSAGVAIQLYLALIAALLLQLFVGQRPNKRMMELIQLHQMGWATDQELIAGLASQLAKRAAHKRA